MVDLNNSKTPEEEKDTVQTPVWFVRAVEQHLGLTFDLDVCCLAKTAKCPVFYSLVDHGINGLRSPWGRYNWCNPPYSDVRSWVDKAVTESRGGNISCLLIPDKPEVGYVRECKDKADTIYHMPFRLNFIRPDGSPFLDKSRKPQGPKFPVLLALFTPWGLSSVTRDQYVDFRK